MSGKLRNLLGVDNISRCRDEINNENRKAIRLLAISGLPLSLVNFVAQMVVTGPDTAFLRGLWLLVYFVLLLIAERRFIPEEHPRSTLLLYLAEAPVMLLSILLGTVWDPTHPAVTILLFLMAMPAFILDRLDRCMAVQAGWSLLFVGLCFAVKEPTLRRTDTVHICEFWIAAAGVTYVMLRVRLESLQRLEKAQYHLEHDLQTDCLNRFALTNRSSRYLRKPLMVLFSDMDRLQLYQDFYGHAVSDAMTLYFAQTLKECFGAEHTYRHGGDEMLCVAENLPIEECAARIAQCREKLHAFKYNGKKISISCAFGYVSGIPHSPREFQEMIRLADIYAHKVKLSGQDQTLGGPFDQEHLRQGIIESNVSTHAHAYEISPLTGLPSVSYFTARADEMLAEVIDLNRIPVIGHFKLTQLREYNSEFGYAQGDVLIADTARILRQFFDSRLLCYFSAGEFGIMCYKDEAQTVIPRISEAMRAYRTGFPVTCKAGFVPYTGNEKTISLLDKAKIACKTIEHSKDRVLCFYDTRLDEELHFQQYVINHVDEAIEKGFLQVYYQPIARAITGEVCNEEALSRWNDPHYGFLMPARFIPTLEENGLMYKVNLNVIRQVLADFRRKKELGVPVVPVSVNLSRRDFEQCDMVQEITGMVGASGFPASLIKIEITESAFITDQELLRREVERFRASGFDVWLDDFGSEYSTLNLLQELDFDLIKIDMKFMKNLSVDGKNFIIISDIIDMARRMGIATLIEGVETPEHYLIMQKLGCEKLQGYLFNTPNSLDYIVNRALSGTGLRFESPDAAPYYEAIGRVDLNAPLSEESMGRSLRVNREIPAGVLELKENAFTCLRGNDSFLEQLEKWGVLQPETRNAKYRQLINPPPQILSSAAARCLQSSEWASFSANAADKGKLTVYLRRVSAYEYKGGVALLAMLLPG